MYHPRLYGEFYDMGYKYGRLLYEKAAFILPEMKRENYEFGLRSYEELLKCYPEAIEEIEGFARGIQDNPQRVGAFLLGLGVQESRGQCSVFAFKNPGGVIIGRNYDMLYKFKKFTESSLIAPLGKYAYISQSDVFIGRSDGINEKGLSVSMAFVNGHHLQPGISFHFIIRKVLEECENTLQAAELIKNIKVSGSSNFLIADREGNLLVVESSPLKSNIRYMAEGEDYIFITNQFISETMREFDRGGVEWSKSKERYEGFETKLKEIKYMDLNKAKEVLSSECICLDLKKESFGTIWSVVADLNKLTIERAEGKPLIANYKRETRLEWWMKKNAHISR